jgi:hypothetical protein
MFITADLRERARFFDQAVGELHDDLRHPEIRSALGDFGIRASTFLGTAYLMNYRHGEWRIPRSHFNDDDIPLAIARRGETLRTTRTSSKNSFFTPTQRNVAEAQITDHVGPRRWAEVLKISNKGSADFNGVSYQNNIRKANAQPLALEIILPNEKDKFAVLGRTVVSLCMDFETDDHVPEYLLHELSHVDTYHHNPVILGGKAALREVEKQDELLAYERGALYEGVRGSHAWQSRVNNMRLSHPDYVEADPYRPHEGLLQDLDAIGLRL